MIMSTDETKGWIFTDEAHEWMSTDLPVNGFAMMLSIKQDVEFRNLWESAVASHWSPTHAISHGTTVEMPLMPASVPHP